MLTFNQVTKTFFDGDGISDVTFHIDEGEFVFVTGPSGSGKTTLMKLLIREYIPTSGEIFFQDRSIHDLRDQKLPYHRREIGVVYQDYKLIPGLNVWENIALPLRITNTSETEIEQRVTDLLKLVGLANKAPLFPSQLSGGEAQRVSIARALAIAPSLIFADEPTGNLDPETSLGIAELLSKINELGTTLLLATHDSVVLDHFSKKRRLLIKNGKLDHDSHPKTPVSNSKKSQSKPDASIPDEPEKAAATAKTKKETKSDSKNTSHSKKETKSSSDSSVDNQEEDKS